MENGQSLLHKSWIRVQWSLEHQEMKFRLNFRWISSSHKRTPFGQSLKEWKAISEMMMTTPHQKIINPNRITGKWLQLARHMHVSLSKRLIWGIILWDSGSTLDNWFYHCEKIWGPNARFEACMLAQREGSFTKWVYCHTQWYINIWPNIHCFICFKMTHQ